MNELEATFFGLLVFGLVEFVILMYLVLKTPALKFLKASLFGRMILIHPKENRYIDIEAVKLHSCLAQVKGRGYYVIQPKDVYLESTSKVPCALVYGNFALNIDLKMADVAQKLRELGVKFYDEIMKLKEELEKSGKSLQIKLLGESVDISEIVDYFNTSERSDFIEAEIQRRTASQIIAKLRTPGDIFKWAVILVIIMIGAVLAYGMLQSILGSRPTLVEQAARVIMPQVPPNQTMAIS